MRPLTSSLWNAAAVVLLVSLVPLGAANAQIQSGWDYDLSQRCVATTGTAEDDNYWADAAQCRRYTVVVENENAPQASCPGPANRSLPIKKPGEGPIGFEAFPHESEIGPNFTVHHKVDFVSWSNPCGPGYYAYLGFADMTEALPNPFLALSSHLVSYGHWAPNGAVRLFAGIQAFWNNKAHILEVNLAAVNWPAMTGLPAGVLARSNNFGGNDYVVLDGGYWAQLCSGCAVPADQNGHIVSVNWGKLMLQGLFNQWFGSVVDVPVTQSIYIGTEVLNQGVGDLYHTDFRIQQANQ